MQWNEGIRMNEAEEERRIRERERRKKVEKIV